MITLVFLVSVTSPMSPSNTSLRYFLEDALLEAVLDGMEKIRAGLGGEVVFPVKGG